MKEILIPYSQTGTALDVTTPHNLFHEHGGVVTKLLYDKLERMDLATFLSTEVPALQKQSDDVFVIRNSVAGAVSFIIGDCVLKYHVQNVEECPLQTMVKYMEDIDERCLVPDIHYPIIAYKNSKGMTTVTIALPPCTRLYTNEDFEVENLKIYTPPMWAKIRFMETGTLADNGFAVAVVPDKTVRPLESTLYHWPLGNSQPPRTAGYEGVACFGHTRLNLPPHDGKLTNGQIVQASLDRFFNSHFNDHLLQPLPAQEHERLEKLVDENECRVKIPKGEMNEWGVPDAVLMLSMLTIPNGWMQLKFNPFVTTAEKFIR